MGVGKRIQELREQKHLSVSELARRSGLTSASVLQKIESEDRTPRLQTLEKISEGLGVETSILTDRTAKPPKVEPRLTLKDLQYVLDHIPDIEPHDREFVLEYIQTRRTLNRRHSRLMAGVEKDLKKVPSEDDLESEIAFDVLAEESDDPQEAG